MSIEPVLFPPSDQFWTQCARHLIRHKNTEHAALDFSELRVIVPAFEHAQWLLRAMAAELGAQFIPPRFNTLSALLDLHIPATLLPVADGERLMALYAQLREHAWLKRLFSARKNTDLLPLAQTLITLSDELTVAMVPLAAQGEQLQDVWQRSLAHMPAPSQQLLSDEAQLVWQIWQSQLDGQDQISLRFQQMQKLADAALDPLVWINPVQPEGLDQLFLQTYARHQPVQVISQDWRSTALEPVFTAAWNELADAGSSDYSDHGVACGTRNTITTIAADNLEHEAQLAAQTIIEWLQQGKASIALIAQDRVVARRIRALLERAKVQVADETGWKLSTTRAASALAAWFDVIVTRADTVMLLDLLKSPYFAPASMAGLDDKSDWVMRIELTLLKRDVGGGWDAIIAALDTSPDCAALCAMIKRNAASYTQRKSLAQWLTLTQQSLTEFGIAENWQNDAAGQQVARLLDQLHQDCAALTDMFSFAEWRVFINLQLEDTAFQSARDDQRVVMLPLNGARLRRFDAVLMAGCDAGHLPSQPQELLFFTNAVRRECGLITREQRSRQQLRDFAELLSANPEIVLSWQRQQRGEDNPVSPWIERLNLTLQQNGLGRLPVHAVQIPTQTLSAVISHQPKPQAAALVPATLSASAYNKFIACPYQFFATRMLGLSTLDALSDLPEKRDYGGWLHAILKKYHDTLRDQAQLSSLEQQLTLLTEISRQEFDLIIDANPAALGMSKRWEKVIPAYAEWSHRYAASGWHFEMGEVWLEQRLNLARGSVLLRGQIDRIDRNVDGDYAVLDYKTNPKAALTKKLQLAQDVQLPFYGLLADSDDRIISSAHYVPLEKSADKIDHVSANDYAAWQQELKTSIVENLNAIGQGAALPAQGTSQVCQYCDVRGLCRKGAW